MAITINGSGSISGISAGGLPDGCITADDIGSLPAGSVIQVVTDFEPNSGWKSTTSTSFVSSGISLSITPSSSSNKVFVDFTSFMAHGNADAMAATIYRNGTNLGAVDYSFGYVQNGTYESFRMAVLDSPATASAVTYTIYFKSVGGGNASIVHNSSGYNLTLMEIAA